VADPLKAEPRLRRVSLPPRDCLPDQSLICLAHLGLNEYHFVALEQTDSGIHAFATAPSGSFFSCTWPLALRMA
jgi:hypothetical protein